jgi:hypothetical protein
MTLRAKQSCAKRRILYKWGNEPELIVLNGKPLFIMSQA